MASIKKYETAKGYAWRVQYRSPDGKSRTKRGFRTKSEAQAWSDKNAVSIYDQDWIDPNAGRARIKEVGERWLAMQTHLKPKTLHETEGLWRRYVLPEWGGRPVASVKPSEVQAWVATMGKSGSTVRQAHAVLAKVLDLAVMDKSIRVNPARGVKLPRKGKAVKVYLTAEQLGRLAAACTRHSEIVWVLGTVGLRWGELAGLQVQDVNVLRGRLNIERSAVTVGSDIAIGTPKTHERRSVAVPAAVMELLVPLVEGRGPAEFIWRRKDGTPLRVPSHGDWFDQAVQRCMSDDPAFPRVTPHGLRHVAAGLMVSAGANVKAVQRQLGHASAAMTLDTYTELFDEDLESVSRAVNERVSGVVKLSSESA
ncbi:tyrosine-type recombinase/integrase [Corynebacterium striatum]|nr:site-specific integrase [Corynebacterium striatum]